MDSMSNAGRRVAALVLLGALVHAGACSGGSSREDRNPPELILLGGPCSAAEGVGDPTPDDLVPPVDWRQDPFGDRSWRFRLHAWAFMAPLLEQHAATGDAVALDRALALALDWLDANRLGADGISEFAWYDMAAGCRAPQLGYLVRSLEHADPSDARLAALTEGARAHGAWLSDIRHINLRTNHGLYQAAGLRVLAGQLGSLDEAQAWRVAAEEVFLRILRDTVSEADALHLEHSPEYHFHIATLLERLSGSFDSADVSALAARMRSSGAWFVMPDGAYVQLGDTDLHRAPPWGAEGAPPAGVALFADAGYGVIREGDSHVVLAAAYHGPAHKHADEGTIAWYDAGHRILVDTGRYGYYYDEPGRIYAESSPAHNTVTRVGEAFSWRGQAPHGGAVRAAGSGGGWHALLARNPLAPTTGFEHERLALFRPGQALVLLDRVGAGAPVRLARHFHFGPALQVDAAGTSATARAEGLELRARFPGADQVESFRGQKQPAIRGYTFPENRDWQDNAELEVTDEIDGTEVLVSVFALDPLLSDADVRAEWTGDEAQVALGSLAIRVVIDGSAIRIEL